MKAKTKLLLYKLFWLGEFLPRPSVVRLMEGLTGWEKRAGIERTLQRLRKEEILEAEGRSLDRTIRLTEKGRKLLQEDRHPPERWNRQWDGTWRMVVFDVPEARAVLRRKLKNTLATLHFGGLQKSIWISPDPFPEMIRLLRRKMPAPGAMALLESREVSGGNERAMVASAWDFRSINQAYETYSNFLHGAHARVEQQTLDEFLAKESRLWEDALLEDPLLPAELLPKGYGGRQAWKERTRQVPRIVSSYLSPR